MPTPGPCDCLLSANGVPQQFRVVLSGISNHLCTSCANLNGTYVLDLVNVGSTCKWTKSITPTCMLTALELSVTGNPCDGLTVSLGFTPGHPLELTWAASGVTNLFLPILLSNG